MSSETSDNAAKLPNRFVIAWSDRRGSADDTTGSTVAFIAAVLALQHRNLAGLNILHDRVELGLLLGRAAANHHARSQRTHLEAEFLVARFPRSLYGLVDRVLHLIAGAGDRIGNIERISAAAIGVAADDVRALILGRLLHAAQPEVQDVVMN